ncbi:Uncharacterised protein [Mycobacteroides abscessus subsp. abscessus]|nr:Uncharacterised protein [Mycobacteroides abscessus subsp. abscessus]SKK64075.1 Uncharacterised protein [Mycobacteroides abscessus subsp. abscessus]
MISQSRTGATRLVSLFVAFGVGVVGCSTYPTTPTGSSAAGTTSASVTPRALVDVSAVWATHPLPPCPRVIVGNVSAPVGLELPSDESVARELRGVMSPGSPQWVGEKLGWVSMWLAQTRAGIIDHPESPAARANISGFNSYVKHVGSELTAGHDIQDSIDETYPEGCM